MASASVRSLLGCGLGADPGTVGLAALYIPAGAAPGTAGVAIRASASPMRAENPAQPGGFAAQPRTRYMLTVALAQPGEAVSGGVTADGAVARLSAGDIIIFSAADLPGVKPDADTGAAALTVTFTLSASIRATPGVAATCEVGR